MGAARAKVIARETKRRFVDLGDKARIAPAKPNPRAPVSMVVAATIALAFPICPTGTRLGIAPWRAGGTIPLTQARTRRTGEMSHHLRSIPIRNGAANN